MSERAVGKYYFDIILESILKRNGGGGPRQVGKYLSINHILCLFLGQCAVVPVCPCGPPPPPHFCHLGSANASENIWNENVNNFNNFKSNNNTIEKYMNI